MCEFFKSLTLLFNSIREKGIKVEIMAEVQADITITITNPSNPLAVDVSGIPDTGEVGVPYSGQAVASGGTPPYQFSATGDVPDGLTLDPNEGTLEGTPAADSLGEDAFVLVVTDAAGATASARVGNRKAVLKPTTSGVKK